MGQNRRGKAAETRWWEYRRAQNSKPSTYRCPLCGELLPSLSDHMLLFPEGDHSRRRHAHMSCVMRARSEGLLPTREEWERAQPGWQPRPGLWARLRPGLWARLRGRSG